MLRTSNRVRRLIARLDQLAAQTPEYGYQVVHVYPHDPQRIHARAWNSAPGFCMKGTGSQGALVAAQGEARNRAGTAADRSRSAIFRRRHHGHQSADYPSSRGSPKSASSTIRLRSSSCELQLSGRRLGARQRRPADLHERRHRRRFVFGTRSRCKRSGAFTVRDRGKPVMNLNELECVRGEIYANVWQTDRIARISPRDGRVLGWVDLAGLLSACRSRRDSGLF